MKAILTAIFFLPAFVVNAQETHTDYAFLGFSADLKYVAIETYADGSVEDDPGWTRFIFVDVDQNSYAANSILYSGKQGEALATVRKVGRKMADPKLLSFNIKGNTMGVKIPLNVEERNDADVLVFKFNGVNYEVILKSIETGETIMDLYNQRKMDLTIRYKGKTQVLQQDKTVPVSRKHAVGYKIKDGYIQDDRLALVIEYSTGPGFEGVMDTYQMLVTGRLN